MPAFMFEKISSPVQRGAQIATFKEPRGVIVQMLDRLAETRLRRQAKALSKGKNGLTGADTKPA